jgi:hypothetical protein
MARMVPLGNHCVTKHPCAAMTWWYLVSLWCCAVCVVCMSACHGVSVLTIRVLQSNWGLGLFVRCSHAWPVVVMAPSPSTSRMAHIHIPSRASSQ